MTNDAALDRIADTVGIEHVVRDVSALGQFAADIFFEGLPPLAVVRPSAADVARVIGIAAEAGLSIVARGGGLSYSASYLTGRSDTVMIDTARMNRIVEINAEDMYAHVESGVTWAQLNDALAAKGLRAPFWGTGSGLFSTIGGTLSHNAANLGSGQFGTAADHVHGLKVVLADGSEIATGSWAAADNPSPFMRWYGPDLTGLFLGDCGAFGIKTEIALPLIQRPAAADYCAFEFAALENFLSALSAAGRAGLHAECFGFDPAFMSLRTTNAGIGEDAKRLKGVATSQGSLIKGVTEAVKIAAAGRRFLSDVNYSLHFTVDGRDARDAADAAGKLRTLCAERGGREIPASIPKINRGTPFPPPTLMIGPRGERWIPIHGMVPHSRIKTVLDGIAEAANARASDIERFKIAWCWVCLPIGRTSILLEPTIYWQDRRSTMQDAYLDPAYAAKNDAFASDPEARTAVAAFRRDIAGVFRRHGATHFQIGRVYPFLDSRGPANANLLRMLKSLLDPAGRMNPGSLGLP